MKLKREYVKRDELILQHCDSAIGFALFRRHGYRQANHLGAQFDPMVDDSCG
jgi:hypothetical protein